MSRTIYNEGRVVGLSAYEIFVKHAIAAGIDPNDVPSEQAWLSSCVAMGSSLILYIPAGTIAITDLALPSGSTLAAANTIIGSFFNGTGDYDSDGWVTNITSYGTNDANNVPQPTTPDQNAITDYLKIVDGNVNQIGVASVRTSNTLKPDLTSTGSATISITFSTTTANGFYLQLTGFTDKSVLTGVVGIDGNQQDTDNPQNGDFIGPEVFPWSTKIVFTVPTSGIPAALNRMKAGEGIYITAESGTDNKIISANLESGKGITVGSGTGTPAAKKISVNLEQGAGITIEDGTGTPAAQKISANLTEGKGIDITDVNGAKKIEALIQSGAGIVTTLVDNVYVISSAQEGINYKAITQGKQFVVHPYNGFCSYDVINENWDIDNIYLTVKILESSGITSYYKIPDGTQQPQDWSDEWNKSYYTDTQGTLNTSDTWRDGLYLACPSTIGITVVGSYNNQYQLAKLPYHYAISGKPKQLGFCVPRVSGGWDYSQSSDCGFAFNHGTAVEDSSERGKRSMMFGIEFTGRLMYLNERDSQNPRIYYNFMSNSGGGLWNMRRWTGTPEARQTDWADASTYFPDISNRYERFGGAWNATCSFQNLSSSYTTDNSRMCARAASYADGYNTQFSQWSKFTNNGTTLSTDAGKDLCSEHLNLNLSGTFYL